MSHPLGLVRHPFSSIKLRVLFGLLIVLLVQVQHGNQLPPELLVVAVLQAAVRKYFS